MDWRIVLAVVWTLVSLPGAVAAQTGTLLPPFPRPLSVYSVKFVCGFQPPLNLTPPLEPPVKPGNYATAINIHNFHTFPLKICKRAVIGPPERCLDNSATEPACLTVLGKPRVVTLQPQLAMEVDCEDIVSLLTVPPGFLPPFIKGFVQIVVLPGQPAPLTNPLSITGVYTSLGCELSISPGSQSCTTLGGIAEEIVPESSLIGELPQDCVSATGAPG